MWCAISISWFLSLVILILVRTSESSNRNGNETCRSHSFVCGNGRRIHRSRLCDGVDDCGDNTEEDNCDRHGALLFGSGFELWKVDLATSECTVVARGNNDVEAIDYDYEENLVVWTIAFGTGIYSTKIGEVGINTIVEDKVFMSQGIAVDWIYNNVYWTDSVRNAISVASMDGKLIKLLFETNLNEPIAIVVNPLEGWMFWTGFHQSKIERAGMDGTHRSTIVSKDFYCITGLTIDLVSKKLFWADERFQRLCSTDYDGNFIEVLLSVANVAFATTLDVVEDWIYWADHESNGIYKADKLYGGNVQTVVTGANSPTNIRVYHSYKQPNGTNYCGASNGNCSHLCLPAPHVTSGSAKFTCACPDGMVLTDNKQTCLTIETTSTAESTEDIVSTISVLQTPTQRIQSYIFNETLPEIKEEFDDSGRIAAIITGVLGGLVFVLSVVGFCVYKQHLSRNSTSMNFVNSVYRKTTEDQFRLENEPAISTSKVILI